MSRGTSDRNLLVGMLAFQNGFVRREQLLSAMSAWLVEKQTPLDEILLQQGILDADSRTLLLALVAKHLSMHDDVAERSLAAVSSLGSVREELRSLADPDLNASLVHVAADAVVRGSPDPAHADRFETVPPTIGAPTSQGGRFRILRPHARGGLGEVHVALDTELNREVALKEIQAPHADRPDSRARFTLEAEITGGLEHPGIVPVYGLGTYADGRPYYAMRFIRGDSLKDAIERFFQTDWTGKEGEQSVALHKLLGRFIDVCNAIGYAHSRGVLHRDLKPGNIMLGKYGETLVVDWGLAKPLGRTQPLDPIEAGDIDRSEERPLIPASGSGSAPTQLGTALGTPAYMSPEQAAGRLDEIGPASDVYNLGATLYHVLTGQPPIADTTDLGDLLRKVQGATFLPPRTVNRATPRALEAICLKAMALGVHDRYATPARLAEDIEHWLADEPVSAASETVLERLTRFLRKHKSGTLATAAGLVLVAIISITAAVVINKQRALNLALATAEKAARHSAERLANDMRIELAKRAFTHGLSEYDSGRIGPGQRDFVRGLMLLPIGHTLVDNFLQIAWDRVTRARRLMIPPLRHPERVLSATFSANGERVMTLSSDRRARIWNATSGSLLFKLRLPINSAQFSPDGNRIIAAHSDGTARLWNSTTGDLLGTITHSDNVICAQFSADGKRAVTASGDKTARVWNVSALMSPSAALQHKAPLLSAQFSPDGRQVLTVTSDHIVLLWDSDTGLLTHDLGQHDAGVTCAQFSPDGSRIVTASEDHTARLWDAIAGTSIGNLLRHADSVVSARFSANGLRVVTASLDNTARIWDVATATAIGEPLRHEGTLTSARFSTDDKFIVTASEQTAPIWDAATGTKLEEVLRHSDRVTWAEFSTDGKRLVTASNDKTVCIWDAATSTSFGQPLRHDGPVTSAHFSMDGKRVVTSSEDKTARIWDAATGEKIGILLHPNWATADDPNWVTSTQFSPDGRRVVTLSMDNTARIWDAAQCILIGTPLRHDARIAAVRFSPDGKRVVTASWDKCACVWDAATGAEVGKPLRHESYVLSAEFSPDSKRIVTVSEDNTARVWNASTGAAIGKPFLHDDRVSSAWFSRDGKRIFTSSGSEPAARSWDADSGKVLTELPTEDDRIPPFAFSVNGKRVVRTMINIARVRDPEMRVEIGEPLQHSLPINSAEFSHNGNYVITASRDSTARIWDVRLFVPERDWALEAISLWTGLIADKSGGVRELTEQEWSDRCAIFHASQDAWPVSVRAWQRERFAEPDGAQ